MAEIANTYFPCFSVHSQVHRETCLGVVLVVDEMHGRCSYAAYAGIVPAREVMELGPRRDAVAEWLMQSGSKLTYWMAVGFFRTLKQEEYRA